MSTADMVPTSERTKKEKKHKDKKDKENHEKTSSTKKRKREADSDEPAATVVQDTELIEQSTPIDRSAKKAKKEKKNNSNSKVGEVHATPASKQPEQTQLPESAAKESKKEKKHKRKSETERDDPVSTMTDQIESIEPPATVERSDKKYKKDKKDKQISSSAKKGTIPSAKRQEELRQDDLPVKESKKDKKEKRKREAERLEPAATVTKDPDSVQQPIPIDGSGREAKKVKKDKKDKSKIQTTTGSTLSNGTSKDHLLETHSPFHTQTTSFYLPLSPAASAFPLEGLCAEHLSPLLLTYYPPLGGVLLSYSNPRMSAHPTATFQAHNSEDAKSELILARCVDEYAVSYVWLTTEFVVFAPKKGSWVEGYVGVQSESLLGLVCWNYFNAVIEGEKLPNDWRWVEAEVEEEGETGYWVDGRGQKVEGRIVFRVEDFEASEGVGGSGGTVNILGTLLPEE